MCLTPSIGLSISKFRVNRRTEGSLPLHFLFSISGDAPLVLSMHSSPVRVEVIELQTETVDL